MAATLRVCAVLTIGLLVVYYAMRAQATQCSGPQCDAYIIPSLALPLLILVLAAVTAALALSAAWQSAPRSGAWLWLLGGCALLGVAGPLVSAFIFRDQPDVFVPLATGLILLIPLSALAYSFLGNGAAGQPSTP